MMILRRIFFVNLLLLSSHTYATDLVDRIVAVAGNDIVVYSELRDEARTLFTQLRRANTTPMPTEQQMLKSALDRLILQKLQLAEARRLDIQADSNTVAQAMTRIAKNNNVSVQQLRSALAGEGVDYQQFQNSIRNQIIIQRLINREVTNRIQVSTSETDQQLARENVSSQGHHDVQLLQILISTPDAATPEQIAQAQQRANTARQQLDAGNDFRMVAQKFSDGQRAISGGDLGWVSISQLPLTFIEQLNHANVNQTIGPFRSSSGFHILKALDFRSNNIAREIIQQTQARHILVRTDEITSDDEAYTRLNQLRERIINGDDFANLARSHSADQASAIKGGDLGWVSPGNMVPQFEAQMNTTEIGQVSPAFKTRFGWHIVQVLERRSHDASADAQRASAKKTVRNRKAKEAQTQYLRRLRDEAYVEIRLDG